MVVSILLIMAALGHHMLSADLKQSLAARDALSADLKQSLASRDALSADLKQSLASRDAPSADLKLTARAFSHSSWSHDHTLMHHWGKVYGSAEASAKAATLSANHSTNDLSMNHGRW